MTNLNIWTYEIISSLLTAWKLSKYGVISVPYFPVFGLNTGKYGPEITPYLDTFHAVLFGGNDLSNNGKTEESWAVLRHLF